MLKTAPVLLLHTQSTNACVKIGKNTQFLKHPVKSWFLHWTFKQNMEEKFEGMTDGKINCSEMFIKNRIICISLDRGKCVKHPQFWRLKKDR